MLLKHNIFCGVLRRNRIANVVFFISISLVVLLDIVYADATEWFNGGSELSKFITNVAMSIIAGYLFYIVSAVKMDADRISRSKQISSFIVKTILDANSYVFSNLADSNNDVDLQTPSKDMIKSFLAEKRFSDYLSTKTYMDNKGLTQKRTLHYFLFDDCMYNALRKKQDLSLYLQLVEPEIQIAILEYFNCNFYSTFSDKTYYLIFKITDESINVFLDDFESLSEKAKYLKHEHEKIYGPLAL